MMKPVKIQFGDDHLTQEEIIDALLEKVNELVVMVNTLDSDMDVMAELVTNHPNLSERNG